MIHYVHDKKNCPEWKDPGDTSIRIPEEDILSSIGRSPKEVAAILEDTGIYKKEDELLDNLPKDIPEYAVN